LNKQLKLKRRALEGSIVTTCLYGFGTDSGRRSYR